MNLIKKGTYSVPEELPFCLKDLIRRMLVVDPQLRITVQEIKNHQALRIGLPEDYILPSPLPLASLSEPIPLSLADQSILPALQQIGFADTSELVEMLSSDVPNMAKIFYVMLSQPFDPQKLDWGKSVEPVSSFECEHPFVTPIDYQAISSDPCDSIPGRSLSPCEPCEWLPKVQPVAIYQQEQELRNISLGMPETMAILQKFLGMYGYLWYHPNDRTIILKDPNIDLFMSLIGSFDEHCLITLTVKMCNGSNEQFQTFFETVEVLFDSHIRTVEDEQLSEANAMRSSTSSEQALSAEDERCSPM